MRSKTGKILACVLLLAALLATALSASAGKTGWMEHEALVSFRPEAVRVDADMERVLARSLEEDFELAGFIRADDDLVIGRVRCAALDAEEILSRLSGNPDILRAEKNGIMVPLGYDGSGNYSYSLNDEMSRFQYYLNPVTAENTAGEDTISWGVPAAEAVSTRAGGLWPEGGYTGEEVVVAVVDTGVNVNHEDLKEVLWHNPGNIGLPGDVGYNFLEDSPDVNDTKGHGTHVVGIIASAANNARGIAGIAAGVNVKIMMLATEASAMGSEPSNVFCFMQSLNYILQAKRAGVNVVAVNNSWTQGSSSYLYDEMLAKMGEAGIVNFIAAGNDRKDLDTKITSPGDTEEMSCVTVGACDITGKAAGFSNYGKSSVDVFAPGANILSTYGGQSYFPNLLTAEERQETTEYYGQFSSSTRITGNTVTPETGGGNVKSFGALTFIRQENDGAEAYPVDPSVDTRLELSVDTGTAFTTDAMLKVTIHNPQPGENYFVFFPYEKNPATTGIDNTLLSIFAIRGYQDGDGESILRGGEVVLNEEGLYEVYGYGSYDYNNGPMDSGCAMHVHMDLACVEEGRELLISAEELGDRPSGLGICVIPEYPKKEGESPSYRDIHFYIDSLAVSVPGTDAAPRNSSYEVMNGTSMASPAAAACYALVAARNPRRAGQSGTDYVRETLAKYLSAVKQTDRLTDLCSAGGYIDLSLLSKEAPSIVDAVCDVENETLTLYGQHLTADRELSVRNLLTGAVTKLPGAGMTIGYAEEGRSLEIRGADPLINTLSEFLLTGGGTVQARKSYFLVKGEPAPELLCSQATDTATSFLLTDEAGERIYSYDLTTGAVAAWNGQGFTPRGNSGVKEAIIDKLRKEGWTEEQLNDPVRFILTARQHRVPAAGGNRVYEFAELRYVSGGEAGDYDLVGEWQFLASLDYTAADPVWEITDAGGLRDLLKTHGLTGWPDTYGVLDGKLFCFGADEDCTRTCAVSCDPAGGTWAWEKELAGTAVQDPGIAAGDGALYLVYGEEGPREKLSRNIWRFDGSGWTRAGSIPFIGRNGAENDEEEYGHIEAGAMAADYGLMMFNCAADGGGNFFLYETATGEALPLYLTLRDGRADLLDNTSAVLVDGWIYIMQTKQALASEYVSEVYRIPYAHLYRTDKPSYSHSTGSKDAAEMTAKRSSVDRVTYSRFRELFIDGEKVSPAYFTTREGSLILTLNAGYLNTLAKGEHPVRIAFADGYAETTLVIEDKKIPKTGDAGEPALWLLCVLSGAALIAAARGRTGKRTMKRNNTL